MVVATAPSRRGPDADAVASGRRAARWPRMRGRRDSKVATQALRHVDHSLGCMAALSDRRSESGPATARPGRGSKWRQKQATELLPRSPSSTDPEAEAAFRFDWSHRLRHGGLNVGGGGRLSLVVLGGLHETRIVRSDTFVEGCAFLSRLSGEGGRQRTRGARQSPRGSRQAQILEGLRDETSW